MNSLFNNAADNSIDFFDLVTHIPVGVCKFLLNEVYTLIYANHFLYSLLGYTPEQVEAELNSEIIHTFLDDEREYLQNKILNEFNLGEPGFCVEHRILRRDGVAIWVLVSGSFTSYFGSPAAYAVVIDITDRKQIEDQLKIDEERFRLALAQTDSTIFDYDIKAQVMIHADKSAGAYGLSSETHNVPEALVKSEVVHPDSAAAFYDMYHQIQTGAPVASCTVKARVADGSYAWRKITMTNIFDQSGNPVRAVGILEDIHAQMTREEHLIERSLRDPLTSLWNKGATESYVKKVLSSSSSGVLFIIDLDCFKHVNDHYGHPFGDFVLSESAKRITSLCRHEDIIGRIGGDEFLIYIPGNFTNTVALKKAEEICSAFSAEFSTKDSCASITCTVGLAVCPQSGSTFEALYQNADIALYEAKRNGKNRCCAYEPDMSPNVQWIPYSNTQIDEPIFIENLS